MWVVIKVATVAGGTIMAVIVYLVMREKLPPESPGTVLYSLSLATVASYFFLLTHRQLLIKAIKTGKKNGLNKYVASSVIVITVIGLGLIIWHGMMSYFQYDSSLSKDAIEIIEYFVINFSVIAFLAGIAIFQQDNELTKL
ncbi:MAG: hypothetical protein Q8Q67_01690 [bacterium]|nr:hypothetical protein [bacterium]